MASISKVYPAGMGPVAPTWERFDIKKLKKKSFIKLTHLSLSLALPKDVDLALKSSTAKWKIAVGHHTIKSAGHHGVTEELVVHLLPILEKNNVDIYMNGHDHCLERISCSKSKIEFLTSGGGSKAWRGDSKGWNPEEMKFYYDGQGFISVQLDDTNANFVYYDVFGQVLHQFMVSKEFHSAS